MILTITYFFPSVLIEIMIERYNDVKIQNFNNKIRALEV